VSHIGEPTHDVSIKSAQGSTGGDPKVRPLLYWLWSVSLKSHWVSQQALILNQLVLFRSHLASCRTYRHCSYLDASLQTLLWSTNMPAKQWQTWQQRI